MAFDSIFPFLPANANSPPQLFPYDVIINTAFPGIEFIGTEPNALYQEIREVNGCLWIVTNAMYNENLLQWDQETNQNTTLPAYALELCDGAMTRFYAPATLIPMTPITWTPLWTVTADGLMDSTPLEITGPSAPMNQLQVTWDPGVGIAPVAREVDITDIDSSPNSLLDNLVVNGVQEWTVNKEGVLIHGTIPGSAIVGPFNNATFTGTTTITGPTTFTTGPVTDDGTLYVADLTTLDGGADINGGANVTGGLSVDYISDTGLLTVDGLATFNGASAFNALATFNDEIDTDSITVSGAAVFNGTSTFNGPADFTGAVTYSEMPVGSTRVFGAVNNVGTPTVISTTFTVPGPVSSTWGVDETLALTLSAPLVTGTVTITGTGGTGADGWDAYTLTLTNPDQMNFCLILSGTGTPGQVLTATVTVTGGTIDNLNTSGVATRVL